MKTMKINVPDGYEIDQETSTFENIVFKEVIKKSPMDKVYEYHKTTKEDFEKLYENLPLSIKYIQKEAMIVSFYNKGEKVNVKDNKQKKWYAWFYLNEFRFNGSNWGSGATDSPASLLFVGDNAEKNIKEAVVEFFEEFKLSRTTLL